MGKFDSFLSAFRGNNSDDDDYDDYEDDDTEATVTPKVSHKSDDDYYEDKKSSKASSTKSFTKNFVKKGPSSAMNANMEVRIFKPVIYEDSKGVIDSLLAGNSAILNLEGIETELAQRIFDFVTGANYALDGHMEPISRLVWLVTPNAVNVSNEGPMADDAAFTSADSLV